MNTGWRFRQTGTTTSRPHHFVVFVLATCYLRFIGPSLATLQRVNVSNRSGAVRKAGNAAHPAGRPPGSGRSEWLTPGKIRTVTSELPPARIAEAILSAERTGTVKSEPP